MRNRSHRFSPSFEHLQPRLALSATPTSVAAPDALPAAPVLAPTTPCLVSPMSSIMLGPDKEPTDVLVSPMSSIMLGPDKEPTDDMTPAPSLDPCMDITSPTNIVAAPTGPVMLAGVVSSPNPPLASTAPTTLTASAPMSPSTLSAPVLC